MFSSGTYINVIVEIIVMIIIRQNIALYNPVWGDLLEIFGASIKSSLLKIQMPKIPRINAKLIKLKKYPMLIISPV